MIGLLCFISDTLVVDIILIGAMNRRKLYVFIHSDPSNAFAFIKNRMNYVTCTGSGSPRYIVIPSLPLLHYGNPSSNSLRSTIGLSAIHSLAGLLDGLKNPFVSQGVLRDDSGRLRLEAYVEGFDA